MSKEVCLLFMFLTSRYCLFFENSLKAGLALQISKTSITCDQESPVRTPHFADFIAMNTKKESTLS